MDDPPAAVDDLDRAAPPPLRADQRDARLERIRRCSISGSDDTTVRFWDLEAQAALGDLLRGGDAGGAGVPADLPVTDLDWVLYTPDGLFDASARRPEAGSGSATATRRTRWSSSRHALSLPPGRASCSAESPPRLARQLDEPPPISIVPPVRDDPTVPDTELTISLGAADWTRRPALPQRRPDRHRPGEGEEALPGAGPGHDVRLVKGTNRFHAMASREGAV